MTKQIVVFLAAFLLSLHLLEAFPLFLSLQGRLTDSSGNPLKTATQVDLGIFQGGSAGKADDGTPIYKERTVITPGPDGAYEYLIGSGAPLEGLSLKPSDFDSTQDMFLQITVGGAPLLPKIRLVATSYAFVANIAIEADVADSVKAGTITSDSIKSGSLTRGNLDPASFEAAGSGLVPAGAILFFIDRTQCPAGYTEVVSLRNRFAIGADLSGVDPDVPDTVNRTLGKKFPSHAHSHGLNNHRHSTPVLVNSAGGHWIPNQPSDWPYGSSTKTITKFNLAGSGTDSNGAEALYSGPPEPNVTEITEPVIEAHIPPALTCLFCQKN